MALTTDFVIRKFWSKTSRVGACLEWTGGLNFYGYGEFHLNKKAVKAHRFAWELQNGTIINGLFVCHKCDNRKCVDVNHLFLGTQADNLSDMRTKGRANDSIKGSKGAANGRAKLNEVDVGRIRDIRTYGMVTQTELAKLFRVSQSAISSIERVASWH